MTNFMPAQRQELRLAVVQVRDVVVRDASGTGDGSWTIEGYAAVFEQETTLYEIPGWLRMREEIARGAFSRAEKSDDGRGVLERVRQGDELVHLNYVHESASAVASTEVAARADGAMPIGGLELTEDFHGLRFFARVDPDDPDAQRMAVKMQRGIVNQASFAFTIADEERVEVKELDDGTLDEKWRILEVGHLYDVCVCPQGAYAQTESFIRSLAAWSGAPDLASGRVELDSAGRPRRAPVAGETDVAPEVAGAGDQSRALTHARLRARASELAANHPIRK